MTSRAEVYTAIDSERAYQDMRKQRDQGAERHTIEDFLLFMHDYLQQTVHTAATTWGPDAKPKTLDGIRKVVALGVACMEQHGAPQRAGFERVVVYPVLGLDTNEYGLATEEATCVRTDEGSGP